ncbi:MAG TPA: WG repeat-containing protein [Flavobacteriales bacterium]|nr:WG repeat-containing protein [Flavobacteriales bacterium]
MKLLLLPALALILGNRIKQPQISNLALTDLAKQIPLSAIAYTDSLYSYQSVSTGKWGIKNRAGRTIVRARYTCIGEIYNGKFPVIINGYHGIADTAGNITWLKHYRFDTYDWDPSGQTFINGAGEGLIAVKNKNNKIGFINYAGELVLPCRYSTVQPFSEGMCCVSRDSLYGFIDKKGNTVIPFYYKSAYSFHENRAAVLIGNKYGFIDSTGKVVIAARFENPGSFSEGLCLVTRTPNFSAFFYIDLNGNVAFKGTFDDAESFYNGKAVISKDGKCWQIDKTGKRLKYMGTDYFYGC